METKNETEIEPTPRRKLEERMSWEELADYTTLRIRKKNPKNFNPKHFKEWFMQRARICINVLTL